MLAELTDRFGPPPAAVETLLEVAALKRLAESLRVQSISAKGQELVIRLRRDARIDVERLIEMVSTQPGASFSPTGVLTLRGRRRPAQLRHGARDPGVAGVMQLRQPACWSGRRRTFGLRRPAARRLPRRPPPAPDVVARIGDERGPLPELRGLPRAGGGRSRRGARQRRAVRSCSTSSSTSSCWSAWPRRPAKPRSDAARLPISSRRPACAPPCRRRRSPPAAPSTRCSRPAAPPSRPRPSWRPTTPAHRAGVRPPRAGAAAPDPDRGPGDGRAGPGRRSPPAPSSQEVARRLSRDRQRRLRRLPGRAVAPATCRPAFADVIFALGEGEASRVIPADYGFHIFQVVRRLPAAVAPLDRGAGRDPRPPAAARAPTGAWRRWSPRPGTVTMSRFIPAQSPLRLRRFLCRYRRPTVRASLLAVLLAGAPGLALHAEVLNSVVLRVNDHIATLHDYQQRKQAFIEEINRRQRRPGREAPHPRPGRRARLQGHVRRAAAGVARRPARHRASATAGRPRHRADAGRATTSRPTRSSAPPWRSRGMTEAQLREQLQAQPAPARGDGARGPQPRSRSRRTTCAATTARTPRSSASPSRSSCARWWCSTRACRTPPERAQVAAEIRAEVAGGKSLDEAIESYKTPARPAT